MSTCGMPWSEENIKKLKLHWGRGKSASEIAKLIGGGISRNAVIGKAHRLKLNGRPSPIVRHIKPPPKIIVKDVDEEQAVDEFINRHNLWRR